MQKTIKIKDLTIGADKPKICVPLCESTPEGLWREAEYALCKKAEILEWRIDCFEDPSDIPAVLENLEMLRKLCKNTVLMCTFRSSLEGGYYSCETGTYIKINKAIIESRNTDMVDLELFTIPDELTVLQELSKRNNIKTIVSCHDFKATPASIEIINILHQMEKTSADILKVAFTPNTFGDVLSLMETVYSYSKDGLKPPVTAISMGKTGSISRLCGEYFGSCITYAAAKNSSAPGQIDVEILRQYFNQI